MGMIVPFPLEPRRSPREPALREDEAPGNGATILILPVVRIERLDVSPPPRQTPSGNKKRRKRA